MTTDKNSTKVLSEILQQRLSKSPELAAKQRRLLALLQKLQPAGDDQKSELPAAGSAQ